MEVKRPDPDALLEQIKTEQKQEVRGKLKIYFGYAAGVGKTYAMLDEAHSQKESGTDLIIGYLEPHTRPETMELAAGLEWLPPKEIQHNGIVSREFDLDAALKRRPEVILVDELAHTNVEGMRHRKRWEDIEELLSAGIDVCTTVNVQHIESLNDIVASITQVIVRETVPDKIFDDASKVELIDIEPVELIRRLREGKVYVPNQAALAMQNFFSDKNLIALREIALRRCADRIYKINSAQRQVSLEESWATLGETLLVCLSSSPTNGHVIRAASRIAEAFHAQWIALYIDPPQRKQIDEDDRRRLKDNMELAERLGARVVAIQGEDIADQIVNYARSRNVSRIVIGKNHRDTGYRRRWFSVDIADKIIAVSPYIDVYVIPEQNPKEKHRKYFKFISYNWRFSLRDIGKMLLVLISVTLICLLLKQLNIPESNIIILYLMGVLVVANQTRGHLTGALCSLLSVMTFNFFFTEPYYSFNVYEPYYPLTFAVMFAAALLTSTLTSRIRRQSAINAAREKTNDILLQTSRVLMKAHDRESLARAISDHLEKLFDRSVACYIPSVMEEELPEPVLAADDKSPNAQILLGEDEKAVASWVFKNGKEAGRGTSTLPGSAGFYMPVISEKRAVAVLGILCENEKALLPEQRRMLWTVAGQIALAIERELLDESHQQAQKEIEREQIRSNLLRAISHDLRTPLTGIYGAANTALENNDALDSDTRKQLLKSICEDADWLIQIVENLLSVTRIDEGRLKLNIKQEVIEEVVSEAIERIEKHIHDHKLLMNIQQSAALVDMDGKLIEQVLINLIDNAIRYTPKDSTIEVKARSDKHNVYFEVKDNGQGIDEKDIPFLFDRFYTKGESRSDSKRGIGLGLSISKSIVKAHGGDIAVSNNRPQGAIFQFYIPLKQKEK